VEISGCCVWGRFEDIPPHPDCCLSLAVEAVCQGLCWDLPGPANCALSAILERPASGIEGGDPVLGRLLLRQS
jgi:hypothetical protein